MLLCLLRLQPALISSVHLEHFFRCSLDEDARDDVDGVNEIPDRLSFDRRTVTLSVAFSRSPIRFSKFPVILLNSFTAPTFSIKKTKKYQYQYVMNRRSK